MAGNNSDDLIISISTDLATVKRALNRLVSDVGTASSGIEKRFAATGKSINNSLTTSMQERINSMVGIGTTAAKEWNGVLADQQKELDRLRAKYSPLFATISNYKKSIEEIKRAYALGAMSSDEYAAAMSRERQATLANIAAIKAKQAAHNSSTIAADAAANLAYAAELDRLRSKFDPLFSAMKRHSSALDEISRAEKMGAISASQATQARISETAIYNAQISKLKELAAAKKAAAENLVQGRTIAPDRGADIAAYGRELDRLRAKFSPIYAVLTSYKTTVSEIRQAHAAGAISADEMASAIQRERQAALASTAAIKGRNSALAAQPKTNSFNTANIAAQFQDIGVTAAMGMSPIQIALQQGTQLSAVLQQIKDSGQGVGQGLAAAFASVISPLSLVTIGVIAAGTAAFQYFSTIMSEGDKSAEVLKEQAALIAAVAERWGDAVPALRDYADQLKRAQDNADLTKGADIVNTNTLADVRKEVESTRATIADLVSQLQSAGEEADVIKNLQSAFNDFAKAAGEGKAQTEDVDRVQSALSAAINSTGIPALTEFAKYFSTLSAAALTAADSVQKVNEVTSVATSRINDPRTWRGAGQQDSQFGADATIQGTQFPLPDSGPTPERRPSDLDTDKNRGFGTPKRARAPKKTASDRFAEDLQAVRDRTEALRQEMSLIGLSNEAQVKRRTALDLEQKALADLREEARKKGEKDLESITLSPDKIAAIEQESAAYARQSEALRKAQEEQQKLNEWNNVARDATRGFIDDLIHGESAADAFAGALSRIADALLDDVLNSIFKVNSAAGGSGGLLSGLFSLFGGGASRYAGLSGGLFSEGGFTGPGGKYQPAGIVHKGEVVWSQADVARAGGVGAVEALRKGYANGGPVGISVPSVPSLRSMSAQSAGVVVNFNPVVDNRGASVEAVARQEKALAKMQGELQSRVEAAVRSAQKRNVKLG